MAEELIGEVTHWFGNIGVAGIKLSGELAAGDRIHVTGHTTELEQVIDSMQLDNQPVEKAAPGDEIGVKLSARARPGDTVFKVI